MKPKTTSKKISKKKAVKSKDQKSTLKTIIKVLEEKKSKDICILDLEDIHSYLSIFVICTVESHVQARAIARDLEKKLKELKLGGRGNQEKKAQDNGWILLDLGEIIVHIMTEDKRRFYDLEKLWGDAKFIQV